MSIRQIILIPMIALTALCSAAVLLSSIYLYNRDAQESAQDRINISALTAEHEINRYLLSSHMAAIVLAENSDLIRAISGGDRAEILSVAQNLQNIAGVEFCTILDSSGVVLVRTHAPEQFGDALTFLSNVSAALAGRIETGIEIGTVVSLSVRSGAPVYDESGEIIGVVSLGFRLDTNAFVDMVKEITGCETTVYIQGESISTTLVSEDGARIIGQRAGDAAIENTRPGDPYTGVETILGRQALTRYTALLGPANQIVGMVAVGDYTAENTRKTIQFVLMGVIITINLLAGIVVIALMVAGNIDGQLNDMMDKVSERGNLLNTVNRAATVLLAISDEKDFEKTLLDALELIGRCLDVDRVQIWNNEYIDCDLNYVLKYQWLSDHGKQCLPREIGMNLQYMDNAKLWDLFLKRGCINAVVTDLSPEERRLYESYDIRSVAAVPLFLENEFWGFFSLDDCHCGRVFSDEEISILTSAGLMLCSEVNRREQADELLEAKERTQLVFEAMPVSAQLWGQDREVISCNQETVNLFGLSDKQAYGDRFYDLSPEYQPDGSLSRDEIEKSFETAFSQGWHQLEWMHQNLNRAPIPCEITLVRLRHRNDYIVVSYVRDLREQYAMLDQMQKAEIAEESSRAKSRFLAMMSHEIRTPMNVILGVAEIQLRDKTLSQDMRDTCGMVYHSADSLLRIINDILDLSKIEAGKMETTNARYDVASMIYDTMQLNAMRVGNKPIALELTADANTPTQLVGDELRIKQILNNLLTNAIKYTDKGTVELSVSAERGDDGRIVLVLRVRDTGQGMTAEQLRRMSEQYARFNAEVNYGVEGTGLGMSIVAHLIEIMNGEIEMESQPGKGTLVTVRLPQGGDGSDVLGRTINKNLQDFNFGRIVEAERRQIRFRPLPHGRVLVVDDAETNLFVAKGLMAPYELSVDTAISGYEAISKIESGCVYDIVFMDHMMPGMDGIEATSVLRGLGYDRPIVALTANAVVGQAEMFLKKGFDGFISKPIDVRHLDELLDRFIRSAQGDDLVIEEQAGAPKQGLTPGIVQAFLRDAAKAIVVLERGWQGVVGGTDDFMICAHAMKSALANIGEHEVSAMAGALEQTARAGDAQTLSAQTPAFLRVLREITERITPDEAAGDTASSPADDCLWLRNELLALSEACAAYDKRAAKDKLNTLRQRPWPQRSVGTLDALSELLLHSEFEEAAATAENAARSLAVE